MVECLRALMRSAHEVRRRATITAAAHRPLRKHAFGAKSLEPECRISLASTSMRTKLEHNSCVWSGLDAKAHPLLNSTSANLFRPLLGSCTRAGVPVTSDAQAHYVAGVLPR